MEGEPAKNVEDVAIVDSNGDGVLRNEDPNSSVDVSLDEQLTGIP